MSSPAAIQATYTDMKLVRTRSVAQLVFEIPIERAAEFIEAFGVPVPGKEVWCAIARLNAEQPKAEKPAKRWEDLSPAQQAGMRCNEMSFRRFLDEEGHLQPCETVDDAAEAIRVHCGVRSRSDIGKTSASLSEWQKLDRDYQMWLRTCL